MNGSCIISHSVLTLCLSKVQYISFVLSAQSSKKDKYLPKMLAGQCGASICLAESGAGSDMGNISAKAVRQPDGAFKLQGTKIFISAGDHDLTENIIHIVLARIEGDPARTRGLSIFIDTQVSY